MYSQQLYPTNNNLGYSQPAKIPIDYNSYQPNYQNSEIINIIPQEYPVTHGDKSLINNINFGDTTYSTLNPTVSAHMNVTKTNTFEDYPTTNYKNSNQQNIPQISNQIDFDINKSDINTNLNIDTNDNNHIISIENKIPSEILNKANQIDLDKKKNGIYIKTIWFNNINKKRF